MGEIKSTLDLVMEKTKHLSMSKEEREAQQKEELKKTVKGLILKFQDGIFPKEKFTTELKTLERAHDLDLRADLVYEILVGIELEKDNAPLILLLKEVCGIKAASLESILGQYRESITSAKERRVSEIKKQLHETRRISGSAVVPILDNDIDWGRNAQAIKETYNAQLSQIKKEIQNL